MTTFHKLARELIDQCVNKGEFVGYADHELSAKVGELSSEFEQTWLDLHERFRADEPTDEDHRTWAAEDRRDQERAA